MEQHDDSSQKHTGVRMAPTSDTKRTSGLAPREGNSSNGYDYSTVADVENLKGGVLFSRNYKLYLINSTQFINFNY